MQFVLVSLTDGVGEDVHAERGVVLILGECYARLVESGHLSFSCLYSATCSGLVSMNYREAEAVTVSCFVERMENIRRLSAYDSDAFSTGLYSPRSKGILSEYSDCPSQTMV